MLNIFQSCFSSLKYEICTGLHNIQGQERGESLQGKSMSAASSPEIPKVEIINILLPGGLEFGRLYAEVIILDGT